MELIKKAKADLSPEMLEESFQWMQKCKISWVVKDTKKVEEEIYPNFDKPCLFDVTIRLKWFFNEDIKSSIPTWNCLMDSPYYFFGENNPLPKKWEKVYAIIEESSKHIIKYWKDNYNFYPEIPVCEKKTFNENYFYWIWVLCLIICIALCIKLYRK